MDILYIVIPAYNEETNIGQVIDDWYPVVERHDGEGRSRLVIIDDGSRDRTGEIVSAHLADRPLLELVTKENGGHGSAVLYGYHHALSRGADYIFQTDSDGQTLPDEFEPFWKRRETYDMVIGSRDSRQDGPSRVFVSRTLRSVIRLCFGVKVRDANTPYRLMQAGTLGRYIGMIPKDFNLSNVMVSVIFAKKKCRVCSIPITFRPRQGGVNSINLKQIFRIGMGALRDFAVLNRRI